MKKMRTWLSGLALLLALFCLPGMARAYDRIPEVVQFDHNEPA